MPKDDSTDFAVDRFCGETQYEVSRWPRGLKVAAIFEICLSKTGGRPAEVTSSKNAKGNGLFFVHLTRPNREATSRSLVQPVVADQAVP